MWRGVGHTSQNEEQERDQCTVSDIQYSSCQTTELQLRDQINKCIQEHIESRSTSGHERSPVPVIILTAEKEVDHEHGDGCAGDNHETVAEEQEAEHVIDLAELDGGHDEVKLHKDSSEW